MNKVGLCVFILLFVGAFIDLGMVVFGGVNGTISTFFVGTLGIKAPWVFFVVGTICGHLFFPMQQIHPTPTKCRLCGSTDLVEDKK